MIQSHLNNANTSAADISLFPPPLFLNQCLNKDCLINAAGKPTTITSTLLGDDDKEQRGNFPSIFSNQLLRCDAKSLWNLYKY